MDIFIDPVVYSVPEINGSTDVIETYVKQLQDWRKEFNKDTNNLMVSEEVLEAMWAAGCYPEPKNLRRLCAIHSNNQIAPDIIFSVFQRLFMDPPTLERWLKDLGFDIRTKTKTATKVNPDLLRRLPAPVAQSFAMALGRVVSASDVLQSPQLSNLILATHPLDESTTNSVEARIIDEEKGNDLAEEFPLVTKPEDLDAFRSLQELWQDPVAAIGWMEREMIRKGKLEKGKLRPFYIGKKFTDSITGANCNKLGRLVQLFSVCVKLLRDEIPYKTKTHHALRSRETNRQKTYRSWKAERVHVTDSPSAIRLHYWRDKKYIILMNIRGHHDDYSINNPTKGAYQ